ncbi:MAG: hypothetical protein ACRDRO_06700 [Pseudonocardiaceae bacterium]
MNSTARTFFVGGNVRVVEFTTPDPLDCASSDHSGVLHMHSGNGDMGDLGRRVIDCFVRAADDAGLPDDSEFRAALRAYMQWAVTEVLSYSLREVVDSDGLGEAARPYFGQEAGWASGISRWDFVHEAVHPPDLVAGGDDHVEANVSRLGCLGDGPGAPGHRTPALRP